MHFQCSKTKTTTSLLCNARRPHRTPLLAPCLTSKHSQLGFVKVKCIVHTCWKHCNSMWVNPLSQRTEQCAGQRGGPGFKSQTLHHICEHVFFPISPACSQLSGSAPSGPGDLHLSLCYGMCCKTLQLELLLPLYQHLGLLFYTIIYVLHKSLHKISQRVSFQNWQNCNFGLPAGHNAFILPLGKI